MLRQTLRVLAGAFLLVAPPAALPGLGPDPGYCEAPSSFCTEPLGAGAFGYGVGEERRYVLGPAEALTRGVTANWLIRLDGVSGEGVDRRARFTFSHDRETGTQGSIQPENGEVVAARVNGTAEINPYGFPVELTFTLQERYYGMGEETFTLHYTYEDGRYLKEVWFAGKKAEYAVPVPGYDGIDKALPAGLFLFAPDRGACGPWESEFPVLQDAPRGAQEAEADDCGDTDVAFANPGFLDIAMPALWEAGGEGSIMCLMPTGPEVLPGGSMSLGYSSRQGVARAGPADKPDRSKARDPRRHYHGLTMSMGERVRVAVGTRHLETTQVQLSSAAIRTAYVDADGRVVRLDLDPEFFGRVGKGGRMRFSGPELWARILFATEF